MADDPKKRGTPDNDLISLSQPHEVRDWCNSLNCTETQLRAAVRNVGNSARKVREYLAQQKR